VEEIDIADVDIEDPAFESLLVGRKVKVLLKDVDLIRWKHDLIEDCNRLATLHAAAKQVTAARDAKLAALREGWDNPNVFQICTLRDIQSERARRQSIGRGLRLCVNQNGERLRGFEVNTLTVIATERYEQFAENLQKEIEADTGIRFGIVEPHQFAAIAITGEDG
jgi:hypothetical protein